MVRVNLDRVVSNDEKITSVPIPAPTNLLERELSVSNAKVGLSTGCASLHPWLVSYK